MQIRPDQALAQLKAKQGQLFLELFNDGHLSLEIYQPELVDNQKPHTRDEVYVIISGLGKFWHAGEVSEVAAGHFLHVPAHAEHRFFDFTPDFCTWVMFYGDEK